MKSPLESSEMDNLIANNKLIFRDKTIAPDILEAAHDAVGQCAYNHSEEYLLHYSVLDVKWIAADSVNEFFIDNPCDDESSSILLIVWRAWVIPNIFSVDFEESVEERNESMCVALPVLLAREVFTYGLGPEFNWIYWEDLGSAPAISPPIEVYESLADLIDGDWSDSLSEYITENESFMENCHPSLKQAITRLKEN